MRVILEKTTSVISVVDTGQYFAIGRNNSVNYLVCAATDSHLIVIGKDDIVEDRISIELSSWIERNHFDTVIDISEKDFKDRYDQIIKRVQFYINR